MQRPFRKGAAYFYASVAQSAEQRAFNPWAASSNLAGRIEVTAMTESFLQWLRGLIAAGDEDLVKIHFHTNEPWKILEYCNSVGEIFDIVVEDMIRQANGQQG